MSLDLASTALQIDGMSAALRSRSGETELRLRRALRAASTYPWDGAGATDQGSEVSAWGVPTVLEPPDSRHAPPPIPADFTVAAVDGSHIDVDRHLAARCFLINTGVAVLTYGSQPDARLTSRAKLYAQDEELAIRDPASYRQQAVEGAVLGAKRTVEEVRTLVEVVRDLPSDVPTLALIDGSMVMIGLVAARNQEFVLRELVEEGFARALEELREMAVDRPLAVASYVSLPGSAEVMRALRATVCPYGVADAGYRCGAAGPGRQPCDGCIGGIRDRELFARLLASGQRSGTFAVSSETVDRYYLGNGVGFFYVNGGEEIGRVEVPSWVVDDEGLLGLAHSLIVDQCLRGRGYPVALMEAHERAVVSGADRRYFMELVEGALHDDGLDVYTSEKARSKRLRWL